MKAATASKRDFHFPGVAAQIPGGFAFMDSTLTVNVGPKPLPSMRAAEYVQAVCACLRFDIDKAFDKCGDGREVAAWNGVLITDLRLRAWLMNEHPEDRL